MSVEERVINLETAFLELSRMAKRGDERVDSIAECAAHVCLRRRPRIFHLSPLTLEERVATWSRLAEQVR